MVDVGGGIGSLALKIAKVHPDIRMVVQDRPMVIGMGEGVRHALILETRSRHYFIFIFYFLNFHSSGRPSYPMLFHPVGSDLKVCHTVYL
jgi:hypothetical protein